MLRAVCIALATTVLALGGCARATYQAPDADDVIDAPVDARRIDAGIDAPGTQCSMQPCSILPQCGCLATSTTPVCDLDFANLPSGATKCRADNFHGTETTTCTMSTTCAAEHVCVGRCRRYCTTDDQCPGAGGLCIIHLTTGNPPVNIPGVLTCTTDCVPTQAASAACPTSWACHIYRETGGALRYLTDCEPPPASGGTVGAVCADNGDCRPGLDCVNLNPGGPQCRPTCICPGGNCSGGTCPGGTGSCRAYTEPVVIGPVSYGACF